MARLKPGDPEYVNNRSFTEEIIKCKETGELSPYAVDCMYRICRRAIRRLTYTDKRDMEDCIQSAIYDCIKYWRSFNEKVSMNGFAYFTQTAKHGYAKEWKKIHKKTGLDPKDPLNFISLSQNGENSIYSI